MMIINIMIIIINIFISLIIMSFTENSIALLD